MNHQENTDNKETNAKKVSIINNKDNYLVFKLENNYTDPLIAADLGEAMATAYRLIGYG